MTSFLTLNNFSSFLEIFAGYNLAIGLFDIAGKALKNSITEVTSFERNPAHRKIHKNILFYLLVVIHYLATPIGSEEKIRKMSLQFGFYTLFLVFVANFQSVYTQYFSIKFILSFSVCCFLIMPLNQLNRARPASSIIDSLIPALPFLCSYLILENRVFSFNNSLCFLGFCFIAILIISFFKRFKLLNLKIKLISIVICIAIPLSVILTPINYLINHSDQVLIFAILIPALPTVYLFLVVTLFEIIKEIRKM